MCVGWEGGGGVGHIQNIEACVQFGINKISKNLKQISAC